jgi:hypothetical protein
MTDYFEIDFLDVESDKSGDAISLRYEINGQTYIHVVDGGFQDTGASVVAHIRKYYGNPTSIDHVVLTHPDGDHAGGLCSVLENFHVGTLWMLRPWNYAAEIVHRFSKITSVDNLRRLLREAYPNIVALEEIAERKGIPMKEPFRGASIGAFVVVAPSKSRYLELVVTSDCTPPSDAKRTSTLGGLLKKTVSYAVNFIRAVWGDEVFSPNGVSAENEMSIVQYARLSNKKILLTADAGREALAEAVEYAPVLGLNLPGIDRFQVPHHGSRRNVSTELLDALLGTRLPQRVTDTTRFTAIISSAKKDEAHPRKAVVRAMIHRGGYTIATEGVSIRTAVNAPPRDGWSTAPPMPYPEDQEED